MSGVDGVVFGAGGGVGFECVQHLLEKGNSVRAVVRSPEKYKDKFPKNPLLTVAKGGVVCSPSTGVPLCIDRDMHNHACMQPVFGWIKRTGHASVCSVV